MTIVSWVLTSRPSFRRRSPPRRSLLAACEFVTHPAGYFWIHASVLALDRAEFTFVAGVPSAVDKLSLTFARFRVLLGIGDDFHFDRGLIGVANHPRASLERRGNSGACIMHTAPSKAKKRSHAASGHSETVRMGRRKGTFCFLPGAASDPRSRMPPLSHRLAVSTVFLPLNVAGPWPVLECAEWPCQSGHRVTKFVGRNGSRQT